MQFLSALAAIVVIDLVLAGDNAIVVGALAAGLPAAQRKKVILIGIIAALVLRIIFALAVTQLLQIVGLILAGGLLLLWVAWRMWREINPRSALIVTYALAGFANLASIGLLVSTIASLSPERRAEAAGLGVKSWIAGNLATLMTGAMIGLVTPLV